MFDNGDRNKLDSMVRKINVKRKPTIYKRPKDPRVYDVRHQRVPQSESLKTLLDLVRCDDPSVCNLLIDVRSIETCLFLEHDQATELFSDPGKVPKNAKAAVTPGYFKFIPRTARQSYASYFMGDFDKHVSLLRLKSNDEMAKLEETDIDDKIRSLQTEMRRLEKSLARTLKLVQDSEEEVRIITGESTARKKDCTQKQTEMDQIRRSLRIPEDLNRAEENAQREWEAAKANTSKANGERQRAEETLKAKRLSWQKLSMAEKKCSMRVPRKEVEILESEVKELRKRKEDIESHILTLERKRKIKVEKKAEDSSKLAESVSNLDENLELPPDFANMSLKQVNSQLREIFKTCEDNETAKKNDNEVRELERRIGKSRAGVEELKGERDDYEMLRKVRRNIWNDVYSSTCRMFRLGMIDLTAKTNLRLTSLVLDENFELVINKKSPEALSGGEKSKAMACFIMALWCVQDCPFRCLDEWDVGLDDEARPAIEKLLLGFGMRSSYQHIFISPTKAETGSGFMDDEDLKKYIKTFEIKK